MKLDELIVTLEAFRAKYGGEIPTYFCYDSLMYPPIKCVTFEDNRRDHAGDPVPPCILLTNEYHHPDNA